MRHAAAALGIALAIVPQPLLAKSDATAPAISAADAAQLDQVSDALFTNLRAGQFENGVNQFFANSSLMQAKPLTTKMLVSQIEAAVGIYGKLGACEIAQTINTGSLIQYRIYICQHSDMLTSWTLAFFKTSKGWISANLAFKDAPSQPE